MHLSPTRDRTPDHWHQWDRDNSRTCRRRGMSDYWRRAFSLLYRAQNEPRLSAVKEPRKSVYAPDCESRSEEAKESTVDDIRGRDKGVREIKGRSWGTGKGEKSRLSWEPVERIGLQFSTGRKVQPVNARLCQLIIFIEGIRRVFFFVPINSGRQSGRRNSEKDSLNVSLYRDVLKASDIGEIIAEKKVLECTAYF